MSGKSTTKASSSIVSAVRDHKDGVTYQELRQDCLDKYTDRATFDREVVAALRIGDIDIRSGRYVAKKK